MTRPSLLMCITGLLLCQLALGQTAAQTPTHIKLAAENSWPPYADDAGEGLSHRLLRRAFALEQVEFDTLVVPYQRGLILTELAKVNGVFNVAKQVDTERRFLFGKEPLFVAGASFYQLKDKPVPATDKWSLPPHTRVGIIKGYEYGDEFTRLPNLELKRVENQYQLINLLLTQQLDAILLYDTVASQFLSRMGVAEEITPLFANHSSELFVAFDKQNPASATLAATLDRGLRRLHDSGEYQQILAGDNLGK